MNWLSSIIALFLYLLTKIAFPSLKEFWTGASRFVNIEWWTFNIPSNNSIPLDGNFILSFIWIVELEISILAFSLINICDPAVLFELQSKLHELNTRTFVNSPVINMACPFSSPLLFLKVQFDTT